MIKKLNINNKTKDNIMFLMWMKSLIDTHEVGLLDCTNETYYIYKTVYHKLNKGA